MQTPNCSQRPNDNHNIKNPKSFKDAIRSPWLWLALRSHSHSHSQSTVDPTVWIGNVGDETLKRGMQTRGFHSLG